MFDKLKQNFIKKNNSNMITLNKNFVFIKKRDYSDVDLSKNKILGLSIDSKNFLIKNEQMARQTGCIVTGNYEERQYKIANINFSKGNFCDCCGKPIRYLPYRNETLCKKCSTIYNDDKPKNYLIVENNRKTKLEKIWFANQT